MFKKVTLFLLLLIMILACSGENQINSGTGSLLFNSEWDFLMDSTGITNPDLFEKEFGKLPWEKVSLPHTPRIEPLLVNDQWQGNCWYRKSFPIS